MPGQAGLPLPAPPGLTSSKLGSHSCAVITNWTRSLMWSSSSLVGEAKRRRIGVPSLDALLPNHPQGPSSLHPHPRPRGPPMGPPLSTCQARRIHESTSSGQHQSFQKGGEEPHFREEEVGVKGSGMGSLRVWCGKLCIQGPSTASRAGTELHSLCRPSGYIPSPSSPRPSTPPNPCPRRLTR